MALLAGWMVWSAASHGRIVREYLQQPPVTPQSLVAVELERRGVRYGRASYWIAHHVTFLTGERVRLASDYPPRILIYDTEVSRASRTVAILSGPCPNGIQAGPSGFASDAGECDCKRHVQRAPPFTARALYSGAIGSG